MAMLAPVDIQISTTPRFLTGSEISTARWDYNDYDRVCHMIQVTINTGIFTNDYNFYFECYAFPYGMNPKKAEKTWGWQGDYLHQTAVLLNATQNKESDGNIILIFDIDRNICRFFNDDAEIILYAYAKTDEGGYWPKAPGTYYAFKFKPFIKNNDDDAPYERIVYPEHALTPILSAVLK